LIAEEVTGEKISQLYDEYIFSPLNLSSTALVPYPNLPDGLINGYVHHFALSLKEWYTNEPENTAWSTLAFTAGAMISNATELSLFTYHLFNGNIISDESLEEMSEFRANKGLGLSRINVNGDYYFGHEGEITGFESITAFNPEKKVVISICCNTTPFNVNDLLDEIDLVL
jgi:D-alanyl-D-alanine carboxypeptidase